MLMPPTAAARDKSKSEPRKEGREGGRKDGRKEGSGCTPPPSQKPLHFQASVHHTLMHTNSLQNTHTHRFSRS